MASDEALTLGRNVAALRELCGLTQQQLAGLAELQQSSITRLENGSAGMPLEKLARIARAFGVSLGSLIDGSTTATVPTVRIAFSVTCEDHGLVASDIENRAEAANRRAQHVRDHLNGVE